MTLRLAESLAVRSVATAEHGRLLHLRVVGQNSVIVNFPTAIRRNTEISLHIIYGGRLEPQQIDREGIALDQQANVQQEDVYIPVEPQYIYSNRSYWYPQSTVTDYATASLRITVPAEFDVVASGTEAAPPAPAPGAGPPGERAAQAVRVRRSDRPMRYLACVISRFTPRRHPRERASIRGRREPAPPPRAGAQLTVQANPRRSRAAAA